jgi:dolichyl-phosphate-mannose--protein O-mannosyl transferase
MQVVLRTPTAYRRPTFQQTALTGAYFLVRTFASGMRDFIYFFPLYTGMTIPYSSWRARMWLDTWI